MNEKVTVYIGDAGKGKMPTISVCTYCMKRLGQAKQSVPHLLSQVKPGDEVVFVDYSCPEGAGGWAKSLNNSQLKVISVPGRSWWNPAHAHNCAMRASAGDIVVFMDIDNMLPNGLLERIRGMPRGQFYAYLPGDNLSGFCCIWRDEFLKVNGYEEALAGWGYEDTSLYRALDLAGVKRVDMKDVKPLVLDPNRQVRVLEPVMGDPWRQNWAITDVLRQRHRFRNNVNRDWGLGWVKA